MQFTKYQNNESYSSDVLNVLLISSSCKYYKFIASQHIFFVFLIVIHKPGKSKSKLQQSSFLKSQN